MHCAKEGHKLECFKENRNVFVEIDRGESLIKADIPCKYGAEYESVMCRGKAMIIEDIKEKCKALGVLMKVQTGKEHEIDDKIDRKSTRLNSSHNRESRMPSSA